MNFLRKEKLIISQHLRCRGEGRQGREGMESKAKEALTKWTKKLDTFTDSVAAKERAVGNLTFQVPTFRIAIVSFTRKKNV